MDVDADEDEEEAADEDSSEGYIPPTSEPSWAKQLKNKMKAMFFSLLAQDGSEVGGMKPLDLTSSSASSSSSSASTSMAAAVLAREVVLAH